MKKSLKQCPLCDNLHSGPHQQCNKCDEEIDSDNNEPKEIEEFKEYIDSNAPVPGDYVDGYDYLCQ